jgi:hypothetical protein
MSSRELSPEWVLSSFIPPIAAPQHEISELIVVARRLWPRVQAHSHREQPGKSSDEALDFASEVWEGVLRSVARTILRSNGRIRSDSRAGRRCRRSPGATDADQNNC